MALKASTLTTRLDLNLIKYKFPNPRERGLYRAQALLTRQRVFATLYRTEQYLRFLSSIYTFYMMCSILIILQSRLRSRAPPFSISYPFLPMVLSFLRPVLTLIKRTFVRHYFFSIPAIPDARMEHTGLFLSFH